jgi:hypothetical protein
VSLKGTGAVAIWHNLLPEAKGEFYQWHAREHMPERMAIPGFCRGRRYIAVDDGPEFFNLYEADNASTVGGAAYIERLNNPTEWTRKVVASFRDVARSTCEVSYSQGLGDGGYIFTICLTEEPDQISRQLAALADQEGISAVHYLITDVATSNLETQERAARADATAVPTHIILIEGVSAAHIEAAGASLGLAGVTATYLLQHGTLSA